MKKNIKYLLIAIVAVVILVPGLLASIGALVGGTVNFCDATPFDAKCICHSGEQKVFVGFSNWACEPIVEPPDFYDFPLETWEESRAFALDQLNDITCESPFALSSPQEGPINATGLDFISLECRSAISPMSGVMVWEILVDPVDGYIWKLWCNENLVDGCPADKPFTPK